MGSIRQTAIVMLGALAALPVVHPPARAEPSLEADTALILSVDVSNSVDEARYKLQIEGIAQALEDKSVADAITSGPHGAIVLALVTWADHAQLSVPWQVVRNREDAKAFATRVRQVPQISGEYTCMARMFEWLSDSVISNIPAKPARVVIDVSGDGIDNCGQPGDTAAMRDDLVAARATINGLPIIVKGENDIVGSGAYRAPGYGLKELPYSSNETPMTLDAWYKGNVVGGPFGFLIAANGFEDFGRAFRQKFVTEISLR